MKKLLTCALAAALMIGLPSMASAKGKGKHGLAVSGEVTAVTDTSITITEGKKKGGATVTLTVASGTPIKGGGPLSALVGKKVKVVESGPGTAKEIIVKEHKGKKK